MEGGDDLPNLMPKLNGGEERGCPLELAGPRERGNENESDVEGNLEIGVGF